jgi:hypothetical protein
MTVNLSQDSVGAAQQSIYSIPEGKIVFLFIITPMQFGVVVYRVDQFHNSVNCECKLISADGTEFEVSEVLRSYVLAAEI